MRYQTLYFSMWVSTWGVKYELKGDKISKNIYDVPNLITDIIYEYI